MKKLLVVAVVALLVLALVACGGDENTATTTKGATTTAAPAGTNAPTGTTTPADPGVVPSDTTTPGNPETPGSSIAPDTNTQTPGETRPEFEGVDILNGDPADAAINPTWNGMNVGAFENHHASLDNNIAYVILFQECDNAIYTDLFMTDPGDEEGSTDAWVRNEDYKWVLTIDGVDIEIERFSVYHLTTYGYVRMDLGADYEWNTTDVDEEGMHAYDIILRIYDTTQDDLPLYYAWMTDPEWNGLYEFIPPAPIVMVPDENRDPDEVMIPGATAFSGPAGYDGETYINLFDYDDEGEIKVSSKLCYNEVAPIVWTYEAPVYVTSYSLVGANDDQDSPGRVLTNFKFYGSTDGADWKLIDEQSGDAFTEAVNYAERNFKLATPVEEYSYFMIEFEHEGTFQLSHIQLWTKE